MLNFVTIFDKNFLIQGLCLYNSLCRNLNQFELFVVAFDHDVIKFFKDSKYENITVIPLSDLETNELKNISSDRSKKEYIWTLTPFLPLYVLSNFKDVECIYYIDADMQIIKNPTEIVNNFIDKDKSILLSEHDFAAQYDQTSSSGHFCVQFMGFKRSPKSILFLQEWCGLCLDWCFDKIELDRFGDQKYLEKLELKFRPHVEIVKQKGAIQAPWNAIRYPHSEAIIFHFHGFRYLGNYKFLLENGYNIPRPTINHIYKPYAEEILTQVRLIENFFGIKIQQVSINKKFRLPLFSFLQSIYRNRHLFISNEIMKLK
tara:strand:- start:6 stop:953 length:948 start_codon:yes stop_codon:yes gene_type:complete